MPELTAIAFFGSYVLGERKFELLGTRTGRKPTVTQTVNHLSNFRIGDRRTKEGNLEIVLRRHFSIHVYGPSICLGIFSKKV